MKTFVYSHILYLLILKKKYLLYYIYSSARKSICIMFIIFVYFQQNTMLCLLACKQKRHIIGCFVLFMLFIHKCLIQCLISMNIYILYTYIITSIIQRACYNEYFGNFIMSHYVVLE